MQNICLTRKLGNDSSLSQKECKKIFLNSKLNLIILLFTHVFLGTSVCAYGNVCSYPSGYTHLFVYRPEEGISFLRVRLEKQVGAEI